MDVERGEDFENCYESGVTGQVGTVTLTLIDNDGAIVWPASAADIIETPAGSGIYCAARTAPTDLGHYSLVWSLDGSNDENSVTIDDLFVVPATGTRTPLSPGLAIGAPTGGPCSAWVTVEEVAACCAVEVGSDYELYDMAATSASQVLYELSGRQYKGACERVVRPCSDMPCGVQMLPSGYLIGWDGRRWSGQHCGCVPLSRIELSNYPVTEIVQVLIDGDVVPAAEYRLDEWRYLTRLRDAEGNRQFWPACQQLDLEDTEEGTFSVHYVFGAPVTQAGIDAAAQLACEIYKSCPGNEGVAECKLPKNATRVTRSGITLELSALNYDSAKRLWVTGMNLVDLFLNTYNPNGLTRPPLIWSPDEISAVEVGTAGGS